MTRRAPSPARYLGTYTAKSAEWAALRQDGLGGSEIAAVLGLSPHESPFSLWHRKRGEADPQPENDEMSWGRRHEPTVAAWWHEQHPDWRMRRTGTYASKARPWQIANPDRIVTAPDGHREVLEVKTATKTHEWGAEGTDEIPVYYRAQVLWYLDVLGLSRARIAVLIGNSDARQYFVDYDQAEVDILRSAGAEFLRTVVDDERPSIDEHTETYQVIKHQHPDIDDVSVEITAELAERYRDVVEQHKAAEADKRRVTSELADAIGDGRRAVTPDGESVAIRKPGRNGGAPFVSPSPVRKPTQKVEAAA